MTYEEKAEAVRLYIAKNKGKIKQGDIAKAIGVRDCTLSSALNPAKPSGIVNLAYAHIQNLEGE